MITEVGRSLARSKWQKSGSKSESEFEFELIQSGSFITFKVRLESQRDEANREEADEEAKDEGVAAALVSRLVRSTSRSTSLIVVLFVYPLANNDYCTKHNAQSPLLTHTNTHKRPAMRSQSLTFSNSHTDKFSCR